MIYINLTNPLLKTVSLVKYKALTSDKTKIINYSAHWFAPELPKAEVQSTSTEKNKSIQNHTSCRRKLNPVRSRMTELSS